MCSDDDGRKSSVAVFSLTSMDGFGELLAFTSGYSCPPAPIFLISRYYQTILVNLGLQREPEMGAFSTATVSPTFRDLDVLIIMGKGEHTSPG